MEVTCAVQSFEFSGRNWNKKLRVTSQQPFKLRTEVLSFIQILIFVILLCRTKRCGKGMN